MPLYLTRFSYTPETWARLIKKPEDRRAAARQYIEAVGGKLHGFWYAFGDHDAYNLWEAPDNVSMAATAIAIGAGGALSSIQTTALLTVDETLDALRKASSITYRAPGEEGPDGQEQEPVPPG
ncbi:GYD domain-containing protein [Arenibaculum sp.]|uniref:GYD domain-containing protein n=1 Tax=Arenibaculum sp. TaxID=2865862 RepID=UPI002E1187E3|nr:GYD domain-containing protein [Arenibaculum sp.]